MRRFLVVVGPMVAVGALLACESSSSSGGGGFVFDEAGSFDAPGPSDSSPPDAGAAKTDGPRTGVTVSVTRAGMPTAGLRVVFNDAAGAVLQVVMTGADGRATSTGVTPSMASALLGDPAGKRRTIVTWVDVKDGDVLSALDVAQADTVGQYDVSFDPFDGATGYTATTSNCGATGSSPISIFLSRGCVNPTNSVLGAAGDLNGDPLAFAFAKGVVAPANDGGASAVALGPWAAPASLAVTVTNAPAGSIDATVAQYSDSATYRGPVRSFTGGTTTLSYAAGFAEALEPTISGLVPPNGYFQLVKRITPGPTVTFDFATALPAILTTTADTSDPKRPALSWTSAAPLTASDGGIVNFVWFPTGGVQNWALIVPPSATRVKAPELPPEGAAWLPAPGALSMDGSAYVDFADVDSVASYDVFRQGAGKAVSDGPLPAGALLPPNGSARATGLGSLVP